MCKGDRQCSERRANFGTCNGERLLHPINARNYLASHLTCTHSRGVNENAPSRAAPKAAEPTLTRAPAAHHQGGSLSDPLHNDDFHTRGSTMTKSQSAPNGSVPNGSKTGIWERPERQGLFDPAFERDACGVGFIADMKGRKSHKIVADALADPGESRAPRRGRRRSAVRRRRRHSDPDPARRSCARKQQARHHAAGARPLRRGPCVHAAGRAPARALRARLGTLLRRKKAWSFSAGAPCRSTIRASRTWCARPSPSTARCSSAARSAIATRTISSASCSWPARSSRTRSSTPTRAATSATTPCRCRAARSSTRACSSRTR